MFGVAHSGIERLNSALRGVLVVGIVCSLILPSQVAAVFTVTGCVVTISPSTDAPGSTNTYSVSVANNDNNTVRWVNIQLPGEGYLYSGNSINGWDVIDQQNGVEASNGILGPWLSQVFPIVATTGVENKSQQDWSVSVSNDASGANPVTCKGGNLKTAIEGRFPSDSPTAVSNILVSDITTNAATISWDTDFASNSIVYYGQSASYESVTPLNGTLEAHHEVRLTGLTLGVTYHFQVAGTDGRGSFAYSADNTFVPADKPVVTGPGSGQPIQSPNDTNKQTSTRQRTGDARAPIISLDQKLSGAYKEAPLIKGRVQDETGLGSVLYSIDGGKNWLPVDSFNGADKKEGSYSFKPVAVVDGNYRVVVRVYDMAGNTADTVTQTLVIDKAPPVAGGAITTVGPVAVRLGEGETMRAIQGIDQQITLSAIGGPTAISVEAIDTEGDVAQTFGLTYSPESNLWSGTLSFRKSGRYSLVVRAIDGAANKTTRPLYNVQVAAPDKVIDARGAKPIPGAEVRLYYRDPETAAWVLWDATSYGQQNPRPADEDGSYGFYLPAGTYYMDIRADGYARQLTKSFTLKETRVVTAPISLHRVPAVKVGSRTLSLPRLSFKQEPVRLRAIDTQESQASIQDMPNFSMTSIDGRKVSTPDLYGKPTVISFVSTWAPSARDQLRILDQLNRTNLNVYAVSSGESRARVAAYAAIAGYTMPILTDTSNQLITQFEASSLPTTYFIDRSGVVKKVIAGVLSEQELQQYVANSGL